MRVKLTGKIARDPRSRVLAMEAVARKICEEVGEDPADAVMMLLTAAVHMSATYSKKPSKEIIDTLAYSLGCATVAADDFFRLKPVGAA